MVKYVCALILAIVFASPAFAQDVPQIEIALGYGNINVKDVAEGRHSGFVSHQAFNLNSVFAIENFIGYYGMGSYPGVGKAQLFTDIFGGRFNYRKFGPVIYGIAGLGGGFLIFPDYGGGTQQSLSYRLGGGVDVPIGDSLAIKVDVSRASFHFADAWRSGVNISTGIVLKISQ